MRDDDDMVEDTEELSAKPVADFAPDPTVA